MKKKGFTVFEALVVVIIFTLLFALVFEILATGRRSGDIGTTLQDAQGQAKQGLENMTRELYESSTSHVNPSPLNNSSYLVFQVPVGYDADGNLLWGADGQSGYGIKYIINSQNQRLMRQVLDRYPIGSLIKENVLANFVQSVSFTLAQNSNTLTISLTCQRTSLGGPDLSATLSSAVNLRN